MTSAWSITAAVNPPRAAFLDYPLGHTSGPPDDRATQISVMRTALATFTTVTQSGTIVPLPYSWPQPWKDEARLLVDHRTARHDSPQYQTEDDRLAATERHGSDIACGVCAPADVPVR